MADTPFPAVSIDSLAHTPNIHVSADHAWSLDELSLPFLADVSAAESPRDLYLQPTPLNSGTILTEPSMLTSPPAAAGIPSDGANEGHKANPIHLTYNDEMFTGRALGISRGTSTGLPPPYYMALRESMVPTEHSAAHHTHTTNPRTRQVNESATLAPFQFSSQSTWNSTAYLVDRPGEPGREREADPAIVPSPPKTNRRPFLVLVSLVVLIVVVLAVILPIYFIVIRPRNASSSRSLPHGGTGGNTRTITGGDGSMVKASDGSTFTYNNKLGGIWWSDPNDPYNNNAYPNSWTPPLNQTWNYGTNRINGVNLGGWFVLEPFITPALYQKYPDATDEWSLSVLMAADTASGGLNQLEDHYRTFITEADIAEIAGAGLNWVRLPVPFWAIDTWRDEPFLAKTSWKYIAQALQWCRKYGIRVNLDLHTIPGSQNGYNHSGKSGQINFLHGVMGMANAQRTMNYIRIFTEFISQPEYRDVVPMFSIMNEAVIPTIGIAELRGFYVEVYDMIRGITGLGEAKGPFIALHDGFIGLDSWAGFMSGADRIALDVHAYFAFTGGPATAPIDTGTGANAGGTWPKTVCDRWSASMKTSRAAFGVTLAGEWSNAFNDCGLFMTGVGGNQSYVGNCEDWEDASKWTVGTKAGLLAFASASMDALSDSFFYTWKISNSTTGIVRAPLWSYQLGLRGGWIPPDPRSAYGKCGPPAGPISFDSWMTGGAGAGTIAAAQTSQYPYPPASLQGTAVSQLPLYTSTGAISTLPMPTPTDLSGSAVGHADGWFNDNDNQPAPTPIAGCRYPNPWDALNATIPTRCSGGPSAAVPATITPQSNRRAL